MSRKPSSGKRVQKPSYGSSRKNHDDNEYEWVKAPVSGAEQPPVVVSSQPAVAIPEVQTTMPLAPVVPLQPAVQLLPTPQAVADAKQVDERNLDYSKRVFNKREQFFIQTRAKSLVILHEAYQANKNKHDYTIQRKYDDLWKQVVDTAASWDKLDSLAGFKDVNKYTSTGIPSNYTQTWMRDQYKRLFYDNGRCSDRLVGQEVDLQTQIVPKLPPPLKVTATDKEIQLIPSTFAVLRQPPATFQVPDVGRQVRNNESNHAAVEIYKPISTAPFIPTINISKTIISTPEGQQIVNLCNNSAFKIRQTGYTDAHPLLNAVRNYMEAELLEELRHKTFETILDIGGSGQRHKGFKTWGMQPITNSKDVNRIQGNGCQHRASECDCVQECEYAISTHSSYYFGVKDWAKIFSRPRLKSVYCIVHLFPEIRGWIPFNREMQYTRINPNTIEMRDPSGHLYYTNPDVDWMVAGGNRFGSLVLSAYPLDTQGLVMPEWACTAVYVVSRAVSPVALSPPLYHELTSKIGYYSNSQLLIYDNNPTVMDLKKYKPVLSMFHTQRDADRLATLNKAIAQHVSKDDDVQPRHHHRAINALSEYISIIEHQEIATIQSIRKQARATDFTNNAWKNIYALKQRWWVILLDYIKWLPLLYSLVRHKRGALLLLITFIARKWNVNNRIIYSILLYGWKTIYSLISPVVYKQELPLWVWRLVRAPLFMRVIFDGMSQSVIPFLLPLIDFSTLDNGSYRETYGPLQSSLSTTVITKALGLNTADSCVARPTLKPDSEIKPDLLHTPRKVRLIKPAVELWPNHIPTAYSNTQQNEIQGIERHLTLTPTPNQQAWNKFESWVMQFLPALLPNKIQDEDWISFSNWVSVYPLKRRRVLQAIHDDPMRGNDNYHISRFGRLKAFIKDELLPSRASYTTLAEKQPRLIQSADDQLLVLFGPAMATITKFLASPQGLRDRNVDGCRVTYTTGMNQLQVGQAVYSAQLDAPAYYYESDKSRFDSTISRNALELEFKVYRYLGLDEATISRLRAHQLSIQGRGVHGTKYKVQGTRFSGANNTACGNTLISLLVDLYILFILKQPKQHFAVFGTGDDVFGLIYGAGQLDTKAVNQIGTELGFKIEACIKNNIIDVEYCSSRFIPILYNGLPSFKLTRLLGRVFTQSLIRCKHNTQLTDHQWAAIVCAANIELYSHIPFVALHYQHMQRLVGITPNNDDVTKYMREQKRYSGYVQEALVGVEPDLPGLNQHLLQLYGKTNDEYINDVNRHFQNLRLPFLVRIGLQPIRISNDDSYLHSLLSKDVPHPDNTH